MDRLPKETLNIARENKLTTMVKLVLSPRNELNNPAQREREKHTCTLAEGDFMIKAKRKFEHVSQRRIKKGRSGETPRCLLQTSHMV